MPTLTPPPTDPTSTPPTLAPTNLTNDPTPAPTASAPTLSPTPFPTRPPAPTPPPTVCTPCDDEPTQWMIDNDEVCATWGGLDREGKEKCNKNDRWVANKYCQKSCYDKGLGYDGYFCCPIN
mmetsp:Transcript_18631/g.28170  ORF Transcript_18631/g.28170 Transcript_18631/m.28170 type:complete len:122 (+) Transcript_18631:94-459(+)